MPVAESALTPLPVFDDFEDMLTRANANVVIIGTPPDSHASYCLKSFAAGAHVICEKPFVSSLDEADRVIAAGDASGKRIALNHEFREMPIFRALRDAERQAQAPHEIVARPRDGRGGRSVSHVAGRGGG